MNEDLPPALRLFAALTAARAAQDNGDIVERDRLLNSTVKEGFTHFLPQLNQYQHFATRRLNGLNWHGTHAKLGPGFEPEALHGEWMSWTFLHFLDPQRTRAADLPQFGSEEAAQGYIYVCAFHAVRRINRDGPGGATDPGLGGDPGPNDPEPEDGADPEPSGSERELLDRLPEVMKAIEELERTAPADPAKRPSHTKVLTHIMLEDSNKEVFAEFTGRDVASVTAQEANRAAGWKSTTVAHLRRILARILGR